MTSFGDISLPEDVEDDADNEDVDMIPLDCVGGGGGGGGGRNRQSILPHSPLLLRYLLHAYAWNSRTVRTFEIKERTSEEHARNRGGHIPNVLGNIDYFSSYVRRLSED